MKMCFPASRSAQPEAAEEREAESAVPWYYFSELGRRTRQNRHALEQNETVPESELPAERKRAQDENCSRTKSAYELLK